MSKRKRTRDLPRKNSLLVVERCERCNDPMLVGYVAGLLVELDPAPLNEIGWMTYRTTARAVFARTGSKARFVSEDAWPPPRAHHFHAAHACGKTVPLPFIENQCARRRRRLDVGPPF